MSKVLIDRELLARAIDAFANSRAAEYHHEGWRAHDERRARHLDALNALRAALDAAQPEPVAEVCDLVIDVRERVMARHGAVNRAGLYLAAKGE